MRFQNFYNFVCMRLNLLFIFSFSSPSWCCQSLTVVGDFLKFVGKFECFCTSSFSSSSGWGSVSLAVFLGVGDLKSCLLLVCLLVMSAKTLSSPCSSMSSFRGPATIL